MNDGGWDGQLFKATVLKTIEFLFAHIIFSRMKDYHFRNLVDPYMACSK